MKLHEGGIWSVAIAISLAAHIVLFWQHWQPLSDDDGKADKQAGVTRLSFRTQSKPQPPTPAPEVKPPPKPKQEPPKPKQRAKTAQPVETPQEAVNEPVEPTEVVEAPPPVDPAAGDPAETERARQQYLGKLLAHIEGNKFYPNAARRRGLQGVIQVSFVLHADGRATDVQVREGHQVLQQAAEEAVRKSMPLPRPPADIDCPLVVNYGMEFRLN